ncbi:hypothetical protein SKAU_G00336970 [Synaphobranchus kaupii]|uniref:Uncharacterized protein n=1 Tax=Synaphobranchus kaupii TaxID=118154 RepID=A0A9Q1EMC2_SYNKA|nr:hypothetical protein SKAU_G00336970 [Synaphobranchus kaupii]
MSSDQSIPTQNDGGFLSVASRDVRISRSEHEDAVIQFAALGYWAGERKTLNTVTEKAVCPEWKAEAPRTPH